MPQHADQAPVHNTQRRAAIAAAAARDHAGAVRIEPIDNFDMSRTIFSTLEGTLPRMIMQSRIAKDPVWDSSAKSRIDAEYATAHGEHELPEIDPLLLTFMKEECDFDVEHADGSFLDHLYFCFEYGVHHYPTRSPLVLLLHSILGTGTNTFAMEAKKMPSLESLMSEFEWTHVASFPSLLRLLYDVRLRRELHKNMHRIQMLDGIRYHRVIDNQTMTMSAEDFWIQLNYQLIHLVDFLPVANWSVHANENTFIVFRDLYTILDKAGKLDAVLDYSPPSPKRSITDEKLSLAGWLATFIPEPIVEIMAAKSVNRFSQRIGHSMEYELIWR